MCAFTSRIQSTQETVAATAMEMAKTKQTNHTQRKETRIYFLHEANLGPFWTTESAMQQKICEGGDYQHDMNIGDATSMTDNPNSGIMTAITTEIVIFNMKHSHIYLMITS